MKPRLDKNHVIHAHVKPNLFQNVFCLFLNTKGPLESQNYLKPNRVKQNYYIRYQGPPEGPENLSIRKLTDLVKVRLVFRLPATSSLPDEQLRQFVNDFD